MQYLLRRVLLVGVALAGFADGFLLPYTVDNIKDLVTGVLELPHGYNVQGIPSFKLNMCSQHIIIRYFNEHPKNVRSDAEEFDYIVVGAGAAGIPVAARLALAGHSTLLIEAGGDPSPLTKVRLNLFITISACSLHYVSNSHNLQIPMASMGLLGSQDDWQYPTVPNGVSCLSSEGKYCRFSRGRALGGSTSINYMLYVRGNPADYEYDIPNWSWKNLRPYFLRYEGLQAMLPPSSAPYHNTSGVMKIEFFDDPKNEWHSRSVKGYKELKFPFNIDVNAESQIGVSRLLGYTFNGERMSTARAYLFRDDVKKVLKVTKGTRCTGVIIDGDNVARGVSVAREVTGTKINLFARKEVILSAGAIGTPQILMLSGVGPADHLQSLGIPVRADLPVGDELSDHVLPLIFMKVDRDILETTQALARAPIQAAQYAATQDGPFASNSITDISIFLNTYCYDNYTRTLRNDSPKCELPTTQIIHVYLERGILALGRVIFKKSIGLNDEVLQQLTAENAKSAILIISPVVLQPASRGNVRLASADPLAYPAIFPNFLSDVRDVDEMIRGITILEHLAETKAFRQRGARLLHLEVDGCPPYKAGAEAYWRCYVRHLTFSVFHATGTAALGRVLDTRLRVHGVSRLRVADLSVLRRTPRGNTAAVAIALGERLADFLLFDDDNYRN